MATVAVGNSDGGSYWIGFYKKRLIWKTILKENSAHFVVTHVSFWYW